MTKKEFILKFKEKAGVETNASAERMVNTFMECVEEILVSGDEVNFIGWGKFEVAERAARTGRNPRTGEDIEIEAKKHVKFKAGKKLNESVN